MGSPAYEFFREFGAYCHEHHPPEIALAASTLVSTGVVGPRRVVGGRTLRARLRGLGGAGRMLARDTVRRVRAGSYGRPPEAAPVLCLLPFRRPDYDALVRPLLHGLADDGHGVVVVVREPWATVSWWQREGTRLALRARESGVSASVLREARGDLAGLRPAVLDLVRRFRLDAAARRDLATYFAEFAYEAALARGILARVEPSLVLGIHFVPERGWQAALRDPRRVRPPAVALVQHGAFGAASEFHDFEGADRVLLWGELWRRELAGFEALPYRPVPRAIVTGHPRYDGLHREDDASRHAVPASPRSNGRPKVLYVSGHEGKRTKEAPLDAVLMASARGDGFDLVIKPHPAERPEALRERIARGSLHPEALADPSASVTDLVRVADVVVGPESTVLFEAARLRRPVVLWQQARNPVFEGFLAASDADGLHDLIALCARDGTVRDEVMARQEAIARDVFGPPGGSVAAGVGALRELLAGASGGDM